jgi:integrase/recombinase XerD
VLDRLHVRRRPAAPARLGDLVRRYLLAKEASGRSPATIDCYRVRLGRLVAHLGDVPPARIRADDLRGWLLALKRGSVRPTSGTYVEGHRLVADGLFSWAVREGYLRTSPMSGVERFRADRPPVRTLTRDEVARLMRECPDTPTGRRNRAIIAFLYDTGVRAAELARLTLGDVDMESAQARIRGKNRRVETVPLSPALVAELTRYLEERPPVTRVAGAPLFTSRGGAPMSTNAIRLWMRRMKRVTGLEAKRVSPHVIRASAATHFAASGASAFGVQRFLRHRTPTMSQRYVDLASIDFARLHATASPLQAISGVSQRAGGK